MTKEQLIDALNEDLAGELGTIIRYNYQASKCFGPAGAGLRAMFEHEIEDETGHARFLSDVIVDLGGEPTTTPKPFEKPEGIKAMLELDIQIEQQDVESYMKHAAMAEELGFVELQMKLEEIAADEAGHARSLQRIVRGL
ncbi:MAG: ferritin-like domain-containing protein [Phycisphaeraceae bacterium]